MADIKGRAEVDERDEKERWGLVRSTGGVAHAAAGRPTEADRPPAAAAAAPRPTGPPANSQPRS